MSYGFPEKHGLYDPANEKDSCGVGFVAHIKGKQSHGIICDAVKMLDCMDHRGAYGCEANTGDGAGILTGLPFEFLGELAKQEFGITLPEPGKFSAGIVFLPVDLQERETCRKQVEEIIAERGQTLVGWRVVPVDPERANLGPTARGSQPFIEQVFIEANTSIDELAFERELYLIRKKATRLIRGSSMSEAQRFYISSLSPRTIIYKGMLAPYQVPLFYPDLVDERYASHLAMVHSRFSTNTFPSWDRAQPNRFMAHNGEINTLRGNVNWMRARQGVVESEQYGDDLKELFPIVEPDLSDSGSFDNVLEFLMMNGRTLHEAAMIMVPEAWENHTLMTQEKKDFYEYHACMMEPWDGPASIAFTDGRYIGALLDRNGLRPSRYYLTHDDRSGRCSS
jgi:glutamate synthase (NADPH/NADH) large chain